jgi:hypothetical protein
VASAQDLCRGWTADDIRRALLAASDRQKAVLAEIGRQDGITTMEIAENLGLKSPRSVRATMAAWSRTTNAHALGVTDPRTGETVVADHVLPAPRRLLAVPPHA